MEVGTMLKSLTTVNVWVQDQDEALAFYTEKLGLELRNDTTVPEMGNFRWLTVGVPGQDEETSSKLKDLVAKGAAGGLFFATDDIDGTYSELKGRGVEFSQEPTDQPYGRDAGFRDPSGNQMRLAQLGD
jgi:predicted enzyme related to lactoylglutathione lyase